MSRVHARKETPSGTDPGPPRWWVYLLRCGDGTLYTGVTTDVARRLATHRAGRGSRYVRSRRPVRLVHREGPYGRGEALRREAAWKRLPRREKLARIRRPPRG